MALDAQPVALTGGIDTLQDPLAVADSSLLRAKNMFPRTPGLASARWGMRHLEYVVPNPNSSQLNFNQVRDFFFTNNLAAGIILAVSGGNWQDQGNHYGTAYDYPDVGVRLILMVDIDGAGTFCMQTLGEIADRPFVFDLNDYVISIDGLNTGYYWQRGTTFAMTPISWTGEPPIGFRPKYAVPLFGANRTVYAQDNFLVWSDSREPFVVGQSITIPESNPITAIDRVSTNGVSQAQTDTLLVRTLNSAYLISGAPDETSDTDGAVPSFAKLPVAAGCVSQTTSVNTPYGQIWCGLDDVWILSGGAIPQRIGSKIRSAIQRLAPGYEWTAHACYANGIYRLALPSASQEQGPDEPLQEQFWLDLRNGVNESTAWYGPQIPIPQGVWDGEDRQGTSCLKLDTRVGNDAVATSVIGLRSLPAVSDSYDTWPTSLALVAFDGDEPVDSAYPRYPAHPAVREPDTVYAVGDVVSWSDFLWICTSPGTTGSGPTAGVFTGPGTGGSWAVTGDFAGYTITDGTVSWQSVMVVPDGIDGSNFPKRSPAPAFQSNTRANDSLVLFELLTKEYVGKDPQLDKRLDSAELSYSIGKDMAVAYQMLPNFSGYTYPGIERVLDVPETALQTDVEELSVVADVRRLAKDQLAADPTKRNSAQHFQFRLQNLGEILVDNSQESEDGSIIGGNFFRFRFPIYASLGGIYYKYEAQYLADAQMTRLTLTQLVLAVQTAIAGVLSTLTVTDLTLGAIVSSNLVFSAYTLNAVDALNPIFGVEVTVPGGSPFTNVWLLFNDFGTAGPDSLTYNGAQSRPAQDLFGGQIPLASDLGAAMVPGETKLIYSPSAVWSCQPTTPEIATLNLFVKTYGRRNKTGVVRSLSTT